MVFNVGYYLELDNAIHNITGQLHDDLSPKKEVVILFYFDDLQPIFMKFTPHSLSGSHV